MPAVSQSAYSPSSSDTGESMLANSPQTVLTKSLPPANIMGLPPTQPTTKVCVYETHNVLNYIRVEIKSQSSHNIVIYNDFQPLCF